MLLWPETAAKLSEKSFANALSSIQRVLEHIEYEVLKDDYDASFNDVNASATLHRLIQTLDGDISKMNMARKEAKYEIVVSHYNPKWYKSFATTLISLSRYLYGFSLTIERESKIVANQKKKATTHMAIIDMEETIQNNQQSPFAPAQPNDIEYKWVSQLHQSVQPQLKYFIQICISTIQQIQIYLEENDAIPKNNKEEFIKPTQDIQTATKCLEQATIILQNQYQQRKSEPVEDHFMIYTLLFTLTQFGQKLCALQIQADELVKKRKGRFVHLFFPSVPLRKWLGKSSEDNREERVATEQVLFIQQNLLQHEESRINADVLPSEYSKRNSMESDWIDDREAIIPLQNEPGSRFWNKAFHNVYIWFHTDPTRFALKFTITVQILALMAWLPIEGANELFNKNHGQWALLSAMVVFNFTVGSTALQCFYRVSATIIGAVCGYICLLAGNRNENPYVIGVLVYVFQVPMWYIMMSSKHPKVGFISLLTLAVITSTGYSDKYEEDLFAPVWKRSLTAIIAIIVVMLVSQLLWPMWARKLVRKHLSDLLMATGIQYSKVCSLVCQDNKQSYRYKSTLRDAIFEEKTLRRQHQLTSDMLAMAQTEPRLTKGKFPFQTYKKILEHERRILYWTQHLLESQSFISSHVRQTIMTPMNPYRRDIAATAHLYFYTLACSLRTKSALPALLPSVESSRKILQKRQASLWREAYGNQDNPENNMENSKNAISQLYWQTYAAGTIEIIVEQELMGELVAKLMGQHIFRAATKDWIR